MSKELQAFRKICKNLNSYEFTDEYKKNKKLIETALKNYEELTSKPMILCVRTHGYTQALIDTICKNYKEVKITNLEDEKKLKALEIISQNFKLVGNCLHAKNKYAESGWVFVKELEDEEEHNAWKEVLL